MTLPEPVPEEPTPQPADMPLPDPFPEYLTCPHCGEPEIEVWCYQTQVTCHHCGKQFSHTPPLCLGNSSICQFHE